MKLIKDVIYGSYETLLTKEVISSKIPSHVGIIMDGNRRFAKKYNMVSYYGHLKGSKTTENVLEWSFDIGVKQLTIYAFSTENFKRSEKEKEKLFDIIGLKFNEICEDERTHKRKMRVRILGNISLLPKSLRDSALKAQEITKNYNNVFLNVALAYGGRQELIDATKSMAYKIKNGSLKLEDINQETILSHLYTSENPIQYVDLLIRTGGDERLSNFLPWQTNGNECAAYFCAPFWPEFRKIDFLRAIRTYQTREQERKKNTVLRIVKLLSYYGKVEIDDVVNLSKKVISIPKEEIKNIIHELAYHNSLLFNMIKW